MDDYFFSFCNYVSRIILVYVLIKIMFVKYGCSDIYLLLCVSLIGILYWILIWFRKNFSW